MKIEIKTSGCRKENEQQLLEFLNAIGPGFCQGQKASGFVDATFNVILLEE